MNPPLEKELVIQYDVPMSTLSHDVTLYDAERLICYI